MTSRNTSRRFPIRSVDWPDKPVMLPPGRARLVTYPLPTGSFANENMIGMVDVACLTAGAPCLDDTYLETFSESLKNTARRRTSPFI
jgi:hypothetical protein